MGTRGEHAAIYKLSDTPGPESQCVFYTMWNPSYKNVVADGF